MRSTITVPSKTFLLGEYAALHAGPAIVLATQPSFTIALDAPSPCDFHPQSPAGKYLAGRVPTLSLHDPHQGLGGLGGSTAEFLAAYLAHNTSLAIDWRSLLDAYRCATRSPSGYCASGYDLLAQWFGGVCVIDAQLARIRSLTWPFPRLRCLLFRTGEKIPTHAHLEQLSQFDPTHLNAITQAGCQALERADQNAFITAIHDYASTLKQLGFTCSSTQAILMNLQNNEAVLAAKGCGSMGADVVLVLCDIAHSDCVIADAKRQGLTWIADETRLHAGLACQTRRENHVVCTSAG